MQILAQNIILTHAPEMYNISFFMMRLESLRYISIFRNKNSKEVLYAINIVGGARCGQRNPGELH